MDSSLITNSDGPEGTRTTQLDPNTQRLRFTTTTTSPHDAYHIAFLLRQKLVADIIPTILDYAEVHCVARTTRELGEASTSAGKFICLLTPPLDTRVRLGSPVKKIVFKVTSMQTGIRQRPVNGVAWTWFSAKALRFSSSDDGAIGNSFADDDSPYAAVTPTYSERSRKLLDNEYGCRDFKERVVEWRCDSEDQEEREWIAKLSKGSRLAIVAWAPRPAFENHVQSAHIEIHTSIVVA